PHRCGKRTGASPNTMRAAESRRLALCGSTEDPGAGVSRKRQRSGNSFLDRAVLHIQDRETYGQNKHRSHHRAFYLLPDIVGIVPRLTAITAKGSWNMT